MEFPFAITSGHVRLKQLRCSRILLFLARLAWDYIQSKSCPLMLQYNLAQISLKINDFCTPSEQKQAQCVVGGRPREH